MFAHVTFVLIKKEEETGGSSAGQEMEGSGTNKLQVSRVAEVTPGHSGGSLVLHLEMPLRSLDSHFVRTGVSFEILLHGLGGLVGVRARLKYL